MTDEELRVQLARIEQRLHDIEGFLNLEVVQTAFVEKDVEAQHHMLQRQRLEEALAKQRGGRR